MVNFFSIILNEKDFINALKFSPDEQKQFDELIYSPLTWKKHAGSLFLYAFQARESKYLDRVEPLLRAASPSIARSALLALCESLQLSMENEIKIDQIILLGKMLISFGLKENPAFSSFVKRAAEKLPNQLFQLLFDAMNQQGIQKDELSRFFLIKPDLDRMDNNLALIVSPAELAANCIYIARIYPQPEAFMRYIHKLENTSIDYTRKFVKEALSDVFQQLTRGKKYLKQQELCAFLQTAHLFLSEEKHNNQEQFSSPCHSDLLVQLKQAPFLDKCLPFIAKLQPQDIYFLFKNNENSTILSSLPVKERTQLLSGAFRNIQLKEKSANDCLAQLKKYISTATNEKRIVSATQAMCLLIIDPVDRERLTALYESIQTDHGKYKLTKSDLAEHINTYLKTVSMDKIQQLQELASVYINTLANMEEKEERQARIHQDRNEQLTAITKGTHTFETLKTLELFVETLNVEIMAKTEIADEEVEQPQKQKGEGRLYALFSSRSLSGLAAQQTLGEPGVSIKLPPQDVNNAAGQPGTVENAAARKRSGSGSSR